MATRLVCGIKLTLLAGIALVTASACTTYNPYTGQYSVDPGKTMAAVGTAAFLGSVTHNYRSYDRPNYYGRRYYRPPYHHHYHHRPRNRPYNRPYYRR